MSRMEEFASTFGPMAAARVRKTLEMQVRVNGDKFMTRAQMIEERVSAGAQVTIRKNGERILMRPDGPFLDQYNATKLGLDYAEWLAGQSCAA